MVPLAGRGRAHPFLNAGNALLILKYSSIYGIAAIGAAIVAAYAIARVVRPDRDIAAACIALAAILAATRAAAPSCE